MLIEEGRQRYAAREPFPWRGSRGCPRGYRNCRRMGEVGGEGGAWARHPGSRAGLGKIGLLRKLPILGRSCQSFGTHIPKNKFSTTNHGAKAFRGDFQGVQEVGKAKRRMHG